MIEKHYVFLINNRVEAVLVFAEQNDELAATICAELGYDQSLWIDDASTPALGATYDGESFTAPEAPIDASTE